MDESHGVRTHEIKESIEPEATVGVAFGICVVDVVGLEEIKDGIGDSEETCHETASTDRTPMVGDKTVERLAAVSFLSKIVIDSTS